MEEDLGIVASANVGELTTVVHTSSGISFTYSTATMRDMVHRWNRFGDMIQHCSDMKDGTQNKATFQPCLLFQLDQALRKFETPASRTPTFSQTHIGALTESEAEALAVRMGLSILECEGHFLVLEDNRGRRECLAKGDSKAFVIKTGIFRSVANRKT